MPDRAISDLWWKNAIVYCLDVETFQDSNGDGVGDFRGLTQRIDYLAGLGVTCIWLMPFYPSPGRDDGYDITDFYGVDPRLGTVGDVVECLHAARQRGIRVIADLVVNHTSHEHPWFQSARSDPSSPYRDWYVWRETRPENEEKVIFPDAEDSNWEFDEAAGLYYLHRFYREQPDLNVGNPDVVDEIHRIMGYWLQLGMSGFRVDAVPYLIEPTAVEEEMPQDPHVLLRDMRAFLNRRRGDAIMVGEVNLDPGERQEFFGDAGDEMTGLFNFILAGALFAGLARGSAEPIIRHLAETPKPPDRCQWFTFARNHDELNLSRLPDDERAEVMDTFAPDEGMRIFGRGIRRRLPPMVDGDPRRLRLMTSLLLSLPGSPVLWYGDEIGMGDRLDLQGRMSVRTPMQWSGGPNAGFSTADPEALVRPVVDEGPFSYERVNVADERREEHSMLNWTERVLRLRKECPELGWGTATPSEAPDAVLALEHRWEERWMITLHNLSDDPQQVDLTGSALDGDHGAIEVLDSTADHNWEIGSRTFDLEPYGFRWIQGAAPIGIAPVG